ncbi:MAG: ATP-grasp domain-containing protein [Acidimicrobiaceae bacterium]|nr:ATP-grasp domain-containing protein [Acidimicrobiaceae bacterium]
MFDTVLVANRGEIAVRVISTLRKMGIRSLAVYSDEDEGARHVREADLAIRLGPSTARESYLNIDRVLEAATRCAAQAVHPGYGFLSENADFVRACESAGVVFIGPSVESVQMMGDKIRAKAAVANAGVRVVPGRAQAGMDDDELRQVAQEIGYPVLVKPSAGGGGKGMRLVHSPEALADAVVSARRESAASFGDDTLFIERYIEDPRHLEVQILVDNFSHGVHLGERECSLQRRHQKVIEEAPSPLLSDQSRRDLTSAALRVGEVARYRGVGTVEFIVSSRRPDEFFFMEMNTRLQVEHPVTEMVTGLDLVEQQLRVAAGEELSFSQDDVRLRGHAIEARIYAEDPSRDFLPTGGELLFLREPLAEGVRVDSSLLARGHVGTTYDPMLAKVIAHGADRNQALDRLDQALGELVTFGVVTNTSFLRALLANADVRAGALDTNLIARFLEQGTDTRTDEDLVECAGAFAVAHLLDRQRCSSGPSRFDVLDGWRLGEHASTHFDVQTSLAGPITLDIEGTWRELRLTMGEAAPALNVRCLESRPVARNVQELVLSVSGRTFIVLVTIEGALTWIAHRGSTSWWRVTPPRRSDETSVVHDGDLRSPMPGVVIHVGAKPGDAVSLGDALLVVEAMKMEYPLRAPLAGEVAELLVRVGDQVALDQVVARVRSLVIDESDPSISTGDRSSA